MAKKTASKKKSVSRKVTKTSSKKATARKGAVAKDAKKSVKKAAPRKSATARRPKGPVWQWSAVDTAAAIRNGAISAVETVEAHLDRMRAVNPRLNAESRKTSITKAGRTSTACPPTRITSRRRMRLLSVT
ncbi:hypothetical protein ACVIWV_007253 [Bradyrhizobium diazoefficiens]